MYNDFNNYSQAFAAWDIRLFLDTHPCDKEALAAYKKLCCGCNDNYACVPERYFDCEHWYWIDDPWPWEPEANYGCNMRRGRV